MALSPEVKAALIVVAGIWAAELKDVDPTARRLAINKWAKRHDVIYQALLKKFEEPQDS